MQDRVVSGVGNWVADEVCFQARVHPGATCNTLAPEQVRQGARNRSSCGDSHMDTALNYPVDMTSRAPPCPSSAGSDRLSSTAVWCALFVALLEKTMRQIHTEDTPCRAPRLACFFFSTPSFRATTLLLVVSCRVVACRGPIGFVHPLRRWPPFTPSSCQCAARRARRRRTTRCSLRSGCSTTGTYV